MTAYVGYHHGLLQGAIFGCIALFVIALGLITYRWWVARSENRHIDRTEATDSRNDRTHGGLTGGA